MKVNSIKFKEGLKIVNTIQTPKYDNQITNHVYMYGQDQLVIEKTNLTQSIRVKLDAQGEIDLYAPWKLLYPIIKELNNEQIEMNQEENRICIGSGSSNYYVPIIPNLDAPSFMPDIDGTTLTIKQEQLSRLIGMTEHCASEEKARYTLNGIYLNGGFVATDGRRLSIAKTDIKLPKIMLPSDLSKTIQLLPNGDITIQANEKRIQFQAGNVTVASTLMQGDFPPYEALLKFQPNNRALVKLGDAERLLKQAIITTSKSRLVEIQSQDNVLTVNTTLNAEDGECQFVGKCEAATTGSFSGTYNAQYLYEYLTTMTKYVSPDDHIHIYQDKQNGTMNIKADGSDEFHYILMPVQVRREQKVEEIEI